MTVIRDAYERAIAAYNAGDIDAFAAAHAEDAVLVTPAGTVRGRAAIRDYWRRQKTAFPDLALTVEVIVADGDTVASEWQWIGTNTGPLAVRDRPPVAATGRRVELKGMEMARLRDGEIVDYRMYWDGIALAQQLGLLPEPVRT